ncbi:uncharacterized protein F5147DRAFT_656127 [Suillus discolor]|uniref:Uncharacterized protein n=1 Tax=Suillus discolor TaxID=1912936 RepID=A0A9P7JQ94_9AGAM|nr:uncharacterized protein F5147DRAFT_656127 [Suillus discolor]KAG2098238.1 hypothetical protein F5147DRAFT_656127 [Suillus discolor]
MPPKKLKGGGKKSSIRRNTLKFGVYNDQPENDVEMNKLVASFKTSSITLMKEMSAIPIIINMKHMENKNSLLRNFDEPEKSLCNKLETLNKKQTKIMGMSKLSTENVQHHNKLWAEQCNINILDILHNIGKWDIIMYNQDKLLVDGDDLANHLSRNSTLHEYKEIEEESLVRALKKIKVVYDTLPENKYDTLATKMLTKICTTADKNSCLQKIYLSWCEIYISTLRKLGLQDKFMSYATMMKLQEQAEEGNKDTIKQIKALHESMKKGSQWCDMAIWAQVLEAIDKHTKNAFSNIMNIIGDMSLNIVACVMLHLIPQEGKTAAPEPLLGGFTMTYAWASFMKIEKGIEEVCRWFETLIDYYCALHPKTHTMDDWLSVICALMMQLNNCIVYDKHKLLPRPRKKKEINTTYEKLPAAETIILGEAGRLKHIQEWVWWNGLKLDESQLDPKEVLDSIKGKAILKQQ